MRKIFKNEKVNAIIILLIICVTVFLLTVSIVNLRSKNIELTSEIQNLSISITNEESKNKKLTKEVAALKDTIDEYKSQLKEQEQDNEKLETRCKELDSKLKKQQEVPKYYSPSTLKNNGVIYFNGWKWTYYTEKILPGYGLKIPGRHTDSNGFVCDSNNYIVLASSTLSKGTIVMTPFGRQGKVYDCGCSVGVIDVYTSW